MRGEEDLQPIVVLFLLQMAQSTLFYCLGKQNMLHPFGEHAQK